MKKTHMCKQTGQLININPNESEELLLDRELMDIAKQPTIESPVCKKCAEQNSGKEQNDERQ